MRIVRIRPEERTRDFYADIGPFFMSKAVRKEMPYLDDRPDKTWFLARLDGEIVGFSGTYVQKADGYLVSLYVIPHLRGQGVANALVEKRLDHLRGRDVRTTANSVAAPLYTRRGFEPSWRRGKYTHLIRRDS